MYRGWGGTIGIPTIDYYLIPQMLFERSRCPQTGANDFRPQELFAEQVVFLQGLPPLYDDHLPLNSKAASSLKSLEARFLIPDMRQHHIYLFPGSVFHIHPEFDAVLRLLLRTDPLAVVWSTD